MFFPLSVLLCSLLPTRASDCRCLALVLRLLELVVKAELLERVVEAELVELDVQLVLVRPPFQRPEGLAHLHPEEVEEPLALCRPLSEEAEWP